MNASYQSIADHFAMVFRFLPEDPETGDPRQDALDTFVKCVADVSVANNMDVPSRSYDKTLTFVFEDESELAIANSKQVSFGAFVY